MPETNLKKMADILGISISTVSRALKDHPDVSDTTKQKVKELSVLLSYEPNTYAINLKTNSSRELGIIVPTIANDFYQAFVTELEKEARQRGYSLIIQQSGDDPEVELENLKRCRANRMAGVFVSLSAATTDITPFLRMDEAGMPIIFFDKVPAFEACNKVCIDDVAAATLAAEALITHNKQNILAIFGNDSLSITRKRIGAFIAAFDKHHLSDEITTMHASSVEQAFQITLSQLEAPNTFEAIFCMSDEILIGVMRAIQTLRLQVPDDINVLAISEGFIPTIYHPQICYVETSGAKLAQLAFSRMTECIAGSSYVRELKAGPVMISGGSLSSNC